MHDLALTNLPIPILWKTSDIEEKRARSKRRLYVGIGVSLLFHALLYIFLPQRVETGNPPNEASANAQGPLVVRLNPPVLPSPVLPTESLPTVQQEIQTSPQQPLPRKTPPPATTMMSIPRQAPQNPAIPIEPPPRPLVTPHNAAEPPSMLAMVEAARARRQSNENSLRQLNAEMRARENPSGGDASVANLNRNLQSLSGRGGTSGVFQILQKGHRSGQFAFRGWNNEARGDWKEVIEVDAGPQGDLELAMVRKMIELIRQHYQGNFNWESHRLGRVIVLSARQEDSAGLEGFLIREFFGFGR